MTRIPGVLLVLSLGIVLDRASLGAQAQSPSILGLWHGTSICSKADWNASCNDEENFFQFVPASSGLPKILLHAAKRVGTAIEWMGDLELQPDTGDRRWVGEFANSRVHIRITYQVSDSGLAGTIVEVPSLQIARRIRARRDSSWTPPPM